jgi:hypothetical protein
MDINSLINSDLGSQIIGELSKKTGVSLKETSSVVKEAAPAMIEKIKANAFSEQGASALMNALSKHDGSVLENISEFLGGSASKDGSKILGHVFGDQIKAFESGISKKTGVGAGNVSSILTLLAPIVMGYIGKQSKGKASSGMDLGGILGGMLSGGKGGGVLSSILEQATGAAGTGKSKSKGGLGDLLGGLGSLFGKK